MEITKYIYIQSTTVYVPSSELGLSHPPLSPVSVPLPLGGCKTLVGIGGWGIPNPHDWRKSLALCLLCGYRGSFTYRNLNVLYIK
jgi:hypothetical protein